MGSSAKGKIMNLRNLLKRYSKTQTEMAKDLETTKQQIGYYIKRSDEGKTIPYPYWTIFRAYFDDLSKKK